MQGIVQLQKSRRCGAGESTGDNWAGNGVTNALANRRRTQIDLQCVVLPLACALVRELVGSLACFGTVEDLLAAGAGRLDVDLPWGLRAGDADHHDGLL